MRPAITRPALCAMCGMPCGIKCAIKSLILKGCALCAVSALTGVWAGVRTCLRVHVRRHVRVHAAHSAHTAHPAPRLTSMPHRMAHFIPHNPLFERKEMLKEEIEQGKAKKVIRCTPENAAQVQAIVKNWPQLHTLVKDLQAAGHFAGLRSLQFTLTGSESYVGKGLGALLQPNAATAPKTPPAANTTQKGATCT